MINKSIAELKYRKTLAFFMGLISVLGFAPKYWIIAPFVAFSVLMWLLLNIKTAKGAFGIGYWFGFAHFALGFSWIGNALLVEPEKFGWLYPITLLALGGFFGLFFAVPALCTIFGRSKWQKWVVFAATVVLGEWLRSFIFTGFPWNLLGYSLAFSDEMVQVASVGGSYFLSLLSVLLYSVLGIWLVNRDKKIFILALGLIATVFLLLWLFGYCRLERADLQETDVVVRIVQPSIPQTMKWNKDLMEYNFNEYLNLSAEKREKNPNFIVWGETASPFMLDRDKEHQQRLEPILQKGSYLLAGMVTYNFVLGEYRPYNSMVVLGKNGEVVDYYHKTHLVPFGEYIPLREYLPRFVRPIANAIGAFGKGNGPKVIKIDGLPSFGGIICYEAIFPGEVVNQNNRPDFLVNLTNDGWYGDSAGPYQHWVATKMRAVEEGITIVRAANNGISGVFNPYGIEKGKLPLNYKGVLDINIDSALGYKTLYSRFGNGLTLAFCLILLFLSIIKAEHMRQLLDNSK